MSFIMSLDVSCQYYVNSQGQLRGRAEIAPDQREKYLQRLQQVQQHGHSNILGMPSLSGGSHKQFSAPQQLPLLQQGPFLLLLLQFFHSFLSTSVFMKCWEWFSW